MWGSWLGRGNCGLWDWLWVIWWALFPSVSLWECPLLPLNITLFTSEVCALYCFLCIFEKGHLLLHLWRQLSHFILGQISHRSFPFCYVNVLSCKGSFNLQSLLRVLPCCTCKPFFPNVSGFFCSLGPMGDLWLPLGASLFTSFLWKVGAFNFHWYVLVK